MTKAPVIHQELQAELDAITSGLGHLTEGFAFLSLGSTNDHALTLERQGVKSGTIVIAARQLAGRGRLHRSWLMQEGDIALSLLLRPPHLPKNCALLPMIPALSVVDALARVGIHARLKWPNDIIIPSKDAVFMPYLANYRKVGGILVENVFRHNELAASIIGIGINVVANPLLSREIPHAMSLMDISPVNRSDCLSSLLICLEQRISQVDNESEILADYISHCETLGRLVTIDIAGGAITGRVTAINPDGSLVVNDGSDDHIVFAGDVNFLVR